MKTTQKPASNSIGLRIASLGLLVALAIFGTPLQNTTFAQLIRLPPSIVAQPQSQTVAVGARVVFTVVATGDVGDGPLRYQWKKDSLDLTAQTGATLTIASATSADAGDYSVRVSNDLGTTASAIARLTVGLPQAPAITTQPVSQTVSAGAHVTFNVSATGSAPLYFQWLKNGAALSGQTSASLMLMAVTSADAGNYSVTVSNAISSATSAIIALTVNVPSAPLITLQPISQTVSPGTRVTLTVNATGSGQINYQWKKNGVNLAGQTSATLTITAAAAADAGDYSVAVSNSSGVSTSQIATLTVNGGTSPVIVVQPLNQTVTPGSSVVFSVTADGSATLGFQWRKNGVNLSGQTSATLTLNSVTAADAGDYSVVVSNSAGAQTSAIAKLTITTDAVQAPAILVQPISQTVPVGARINLSVTATGSGQLRYQWKKNGVDLAGQTAATLTINAAAAADAGDYSVAVSNDSGVTASTVVSLIVNVVGAPKITLQPVQQNVTAGATVTFTANAEGTGPLSFQWKKNGVNLSGATSASLTLNSVAAADAGDYSVVVSNSTGATTSAEATLNVVAQPPTSVSVDRSFLNGAISNLTAIAVQADGKVVVVGGFTSIAGTPRNGIARLNADGSLDASFGAGAGANGTVRDAQIQSDGKVLIAGEFTSVQGAGRNRIARLNADGSLDASFNASASGAVNTMVIQSDGKVVIGGEFTSVNGLGRTFVARLNVDGSADTSFGASGGPNGAVADLEVQTDGKIVVGGAFTSVQGAFRGGLARLNADGSVDTSFGASTGAGTNGTVNEVELQTNGKILLAGSFATVNGVPRLNLARLNADGSLDLSFDAGLAAGANINSLRVQSDGRILTGGQFSLGIGGGSIARLNTDGSLDIGFEAASLTLGPVADIEIQSDGKIVIGSGSTITRLLNGLGLQVPRLLNIIRSQGTVQLSVSTEVGKTYVLETQTSITGTTWNELSTAVGDGSVKSFTDASATGSVRFYRIRVK